MKYNKVSENDLLTIQDNIYKNKSLSEIGRILDLSPGTIKRIIEEFNIDTSSYSKVKVTKKRRLPSAEELEYIKKTLQNGGFKTEIQKELNISQQMLSSWCHRYNIDLTNYKKKGSRNKIFTKEQISDIQKRILNNERYEDIGKIYGISRNLISKIVKENSLKTNRERNITLTDKEINALKVLSKKNISLYKAAQIFSTTTEALLPLIEKNNIEWVYDNSKMEYPNLIGCLNIVLKSQSEISKEFSLDDAIFLKDNLLKIPFIEISDILNKNKDYLKRLISILGLNDIFNADSLTGSNYKEKFIEDLNNEEFSNTYLSYKYGLSSQSIADFRKNKLNKFSNSASKSNSKTSLEFKFEDILNEIDLTFKYHKIILNYEVDYYLGQKIIIEVQGSRYHKNRIDSKDFETADKIKKDFLQENGYKVIQVSEEDILNNKDKIAYYILNEYFSHLKTPGPS